MLRQLCGIINNAQNINGVFVAAKAEAYGYKQGSLTFFTPSGERVDVEYVVFGTDVCIMYNTVQNSSLYVKQFIANLRAELLSEARAA